MLRWAVAPEHLLQSHENLSYFSSNWPQLSRSRQLSDLVSCALTETEGHRLLSLSLPPSLYLASCFLSVIFYEFHGYIMTMDAHGPYIHSSFSGSNIPDGSCSTKRLKFHHGSPLLSALQAAQFVFPPPNVKPLFILFYLIEEFWFPVDFKRKKIIALSYEDMLFEFYCKLYHLRVWMGVFKFTELSIWQICKT